MSHELSANPIKVRILDLKNSKLSETIVFIGSVDTNLKKELTAIEHSHNNGKKYTQRYVQKFYGNNWKTILGLDDTTGGNDLHDDNDIIGGNDKSFNNELVRSMIIMGGDEQLDDQFVESIDQNDILNDILPPGDILTSDLDEQQADQQSDQQSDQQANQHTNQQVNESNDESNQLNNLLGINEMITLDNVNLDEKVETKVKLKKGRSIKFVFNISLYPADSILDFKYKLYLVTGIPIYRQHLYAKTNKIINMYSIEIDKHPYHINIEKLTSYYNGEKTDTDAVEGVPIDMSMYNKKDVLQVIARDTFNLLLTNYQNHNVSEYYLIDLNDLISPDDIFNKLSKDKYQLEIIYYGFIILYFPMITYDIFVNYLKNEDNFQEMYPDLMPNKNYLRRIYEIENNITSQSYDTYNDDNKLKSKLKSKIFSSIISTNVSINNYKQDVNLLLVLRNIFDVIELNDTITYTKANLLFDNHNVILRKAYMNEPEPKENIPMNSIMIKIKISPDVNEHIKLILFKNGNYTIKTEWREENHMTFATIIKVVSSKINPVIQLLNKNANVKYYKIDIPELSKNNAIFTETSVVFYYDDDITERKFTTFKNILNDFVQAKIMYKREDNLDASLQYFFSKGMYKYDVNRIEHSIYLDNYYDFLSNGTTKQKWNTIFQRTHVLQIFNTSNKLKIIINGIKDDIEMEFFYLYLIGMLTIFYLNTKDSKINADETINAKSKRTLKNLKLQDPILYDFKKIYNSNVIYSKICQKPYQPLMLNDDEYNSLSNIRKKKSVKYWNYTKQKPVWYSCPNEKFPFVKFIVKQHPKDFCIPCCKKIEMSDHVNIKKQAIHSTCMKEHKYSGEKVNLTKGSHYVAMYGKDIEVGRISRLPEDTLEPLLFDVYMPKSEKGVKKSIDPECMTLDGYYVFGVEQSIGNIKSIGYLYCIVHGLGLDLSSFLVTCSKKIAADKHSGDLLKELGITEKNIFSLSNFENMLDDKINWNNVFIKIAYYYFGINTVIFEDKGHQQINLILPKDLKNPDEMFPSGHKCLVIMKKREKYYPIYLLNNEMFKRTGVIDTKIFSNESGLITIVIAMVRHFFESNEHEKIKMNIDLSIIKQFAADNKLTISMYYINYSNLCYGVVIDGVYLPISSSYYSIDNSISLEFKPMSTPPNFKDLKRIMVLYNGWVSTKSKRIFGSTDVDIYPKIIIEKWLQCNEIIGFICKDINYYCKGMNISDLKHHIDINKHNNNTNKRDISHTNNNDIPIFILQHNPITINNIIYKLKNKEKLNSTNEITIKLDKSLYKYYLYQLVLLQYIKIFSKSRNITMRKKLISGIIKVNLNNNLNQLKEIIADLDVEDSNKMKKILARYISHREKKTLINDIHESYFDFDRVILEKYKVMSYNDVVKDLHRLSKSFVKFGNIDKMPKFQFTNMLDTCSGQDVDYCSGNKFIISKKDLDNVLSVLAQDIANPLKWKWIFNNVFIEKTVNYFKFIRRKNEHITIEFLS